MLVSIGYSREPAGPSFEIDQESEDLLEQGTAHVHEGEHEKAIAVVSEAIRRNPKDPFLYQSRAMVYEDKGEIEKAQADFAMAKRLGYDEAFMPDADEAIRRNPRSRNMADDPWLSVKMLVFIGGIVFLLFFTWAGRFVWRCWHWQTDDDFGDPPPGAKRLGD